MSDSISFEVPLDTPIQQRADREATHLRIQVFYRKGGESLYDNKTYPAGIYVSVGPITVKDGMVSFIMFSSKARLYEPAARLNRKRVQAVFELVKADFEAKRGLAWDLASAILPDENDAPPT